MDRNRIRKMLGGVVGRVAWSVIIGAAVAIVLTLCLVALPFQQYLFSQTGAGYHVRESEHAAIVSEFEVFAKKSYWIAEIRGDSLFGDLPTIDLPDWVRLPWNAGVPLGRSVLAEGFGWPWVMLRRSSVDGVGVGDSIAIAWFNVPVRPVLGGLLGNVAIFGCFAFALLTFVRLLKRWRRGVRGQCLDCAYPLQGIASARCPECGERRAGTQGGEPPARQSRPSPI